MASSSAPHHRCIRIFVMVMLRKSTTCHQRLQYYNYLCLDYKMKVKETELNLSAVQSLWWIGDLYRRCTKEMGRKSLLIRIISWHGSLHLSAYSLPSSIPVSYPFIVGNRVVASKGCGIMIRLLDDHGWRTLELLFHSRRSVFLAAWTKEEACQNSLFMGSCF